MDASTPISCVNEHGSVLPLRVRYEFASEALVMEGLGFGNDRDEHHTSTQQLLVLSSMVFTRDCDGTQTSREMTWGRWRAAAVRSAHMNGVDTTVTVTVSVSVSSSSSDQVHVQVVMNWDETNQIEMVWSDCWMCTWSPWMQPQQQLHDITTDSTKYMLQVLYLL